MRLNKDLFFILLLIIFGIVGIKALFHTGYFTSHDGWHQVVRLYYYFQSVKEGIWPPDYVFKLFANYGYPLFIFNYHLPWIIALPFMAINLSVFDSIKAVYMIGFIFSGIAMYLWLRSHFDKLGSFVGALIYMWSPYRFVNIYVRGAIGEATIFIFIPLLLLAIDKLKKKFSWGMVVLGALAFTGMVLSHAIVAMLIGGFILFYAFTGIIFSKNRLSLVKRFLLLFFLGISLSAFYWLPSVSLKIDTQFNTRFQNVFDGHFATLFEMIYSKWGYGFSSPRNSDSMSFQVGIVNWLGVILVTGAFIYLLFKKKKLKHWDSLMPIYFCLLVSIFLITPYSKFFWEFVSRNIFTVDFPWRLLALIVLYTTYLIALFFNILKGNIRYLLAILFIFIAFYTNRNHLRVNQYTQIPLSLYLASERTSNTYDEYLPKWANGDEAKEQKKGVLLSTKDGTEFPPSSFNINNVSYDYNNSKETVVVVHLFYFPGMTVTIDNKKVESTVTNSGLVSFPVSSGKHTISVKYSGTATAKIGKYLSLVSLLSMFILLIKKPKVYLT